MGTTDSGVFVLDGDDVQVIVDARSAEVPRIVHWGRPLGLDADGLRTFADASVPQIASNSVDSPVPFSIVPDASRGWNGAPGVEGHRAGSDFALQLSLRSAALDTASDPRVAARLVVDLVDDDLAVSAHLLLDVLHSGLVRSRLSVRNDGTAPYTVDAVRLGLPVPTRATEVLDFAGRHMREAQAQRHALTVGTHAREGRHGRTGHDASLLYAVGTAGFGFRRGEVWAAQTAWSGNHRTFVERQTNGRTILGGEEILLPGEVVLAAGEEYETPWIYGSYGRGIDEVGTRFHRHLRARSRHRATVRPVVLNTWEAVYFDHEPGAVFDLASSAAAVGVERFVLDDGWFLGRRSKQAGLGDWTVDRTIWPDGLRPLADHVRGLGMEFGLWFEPEMINPDSDAARSHPEWILGAGHRNPPTSRYQQVLDLQNPEAYAHVRDAIAGHVRELDLAFIKWDHNRDLIDAGREGGRAAVHGQTLAFYRLLDDLHAEFPDLEIESCSSGGARSDLEVLERSDRIWASDCIDAHERQRIDLWTGVTVPPELLGSHIGSDVAHATGRRHRLSYRAMTALMSNLGIEWDLREASEDDLEALRGWVDLYKQLRPLLHNGDVVRSDHPDPSLSIRGVVAPDRGDAVFSIAAVATGVGAPPGAVTLPGLDPTALYDVRSAAPADGVLQYNGHPLPAWWASGIRTTGEALGHAGVQLPALAPDNAVLIRATRVQEVR
ncbi:alpha-galactosidase [Microbacterium sp. 1.5R]|uniref:alpha-galactosidase n=1 Tax=Microbacterium sp. 1.5R TaxID=1916917 RepID=UPI001C92E33A|nr:alpha-galactosidase [Microbacterium sp. 1.5R]